MVIYTQKLSNRFKTTTSVLLCVQTLAKPDIMLLLQKLYQVYTGVIK